MKTFLLGLVTLALAGGASAVTLYQTDDFTGGTQGWTNVPGTPSTADTGLAGGPYLTNTSTGNNGGNAGSRQVFWNQAQWQGDYIAAGVTGVTFDAFTSGATMDLRFAFEGAGGWFMTDAIRVEDFAAGPALEPFSLSLLESDLTYVSGGSNSYAATMGNVTRVEILAAAGTPFVGGGGILVGDRIATTLQIDNIQAVPEPGVAVLSVLGLVALAHRRRRRS